MNNTQSKPKILVVYFSATGITARVAEKVAAVTGGELDAILPVEPYTDADLDWTDKQSRSSVEMGDPHARPAIKLLQKNVVDYDMIFIGYPIWWDLAPREMNTFMECYDLRGKTIIPFATSGGSSIANSVKALKREYPALNWKEGRLLNQPHEKMIRSWLDKVGV